MKQRVLADSGAYFDCHGGAVRKSLIQWEWAGLPGLIASLSLCFLIGADCLAQNSIQPGIKGTDSEPSQVPLGGLTNLSGKIGTNGVILRKPVTTDLAEMQARDPFLKLLTNSAGEVVLDYQYFRPNTNSLAPSDKPVIDINEHGATARNGRHTVDFDGNLNRDDAVVIHLPDGQVLQIRPAALSISDAAGNRVWLAQLQDCEGSVLPEIGKGDEARILYKDAFDKISADVMITYGLNSLEQDIILREQPGVPDAIDQATARMEVWSEVFQAPEPKTTLNKVVFREAGKAGKDMQAVLADDEAIDWGSMRLMGGKALQAGTSKVEAGARSAVVKQWVHQDKRTFLVESVDYISVQASLATLEKRQAQVAPVTSVKDLAFLEIPKDAGSRKHEPKRALRKTTLMAANNSRPGVVIDYLLVNTSLLNINFGYACSGKLGYVYKTETSDQWNALLTLWSSTGSLANLIWSDGSSSGNPGISLTLENTPGGWGNSTGNPMVDSYVYPQNGGNAVAKLDHIPAGYYDFYIYGMYGDTGIGLVNGKYVLTVGGNDSGQGLKTTVPQSGWGALNWTEGQHYALYSHVFVGTGQQVAITAMPGNGVALFNGIQMVASGSFNYPPSISDIPNYSIVSGSTLGPVSFSIGDIETTASSLGVSAASGNTTLVPNSNISLGGSWGSRTITVIPVAGQIGSTTITVTVSDGTAQTSDSFVLTVTPSSPYVEISKAVMTVSPTDCSSYWPDWTANRVIDGLLPTNPGWHAGANSQYSANEWVRVNLNSTYNVGQIEYYPREAAYNGTFLDYKIFVSSSPDPAQWGTPVAQGTWSWPNGAEKKTVSFAPKQGQYVFFQSDLSVNGWAGAAEVWIYKMANTAPSIGFISDQTINPVSSTGPISFTVGDTETAAGSLALNASSSNPSVIPVGNITFGGSGAGRTVTVTSANQPGSSLITVTVTDAGGLTATRSFTLTVLNPDSDNDGLPDAWEMQYFGNLSQMGSGDYDNDGITNIQEYQLGFNPATSNQAIVSVKTIQSTAIEGSVINARFQINRTGGNLGSAMTVTYTLGGTALNGSDYAALPGILVIPAHTSSMIIEIAALQDNQNEPEETVVLNLAVNGNSYAIGSPNSASATIRDDSVIRPNFDAFLLAPQDDAPSAWANLGFTINYYGNLYSGLFVNNNGNVTFEQPLENYTPDSLISAAQKIIAPFWADVDTRPANTLDVSYGTGLIGGRNAFGVNWLNAGYFNVNDDKLNDFQLILIERGDTGSGNFNVEFNYNRIQWETGDNAVGHPSQGVNGFGGVSARAGFADGVANSLELQGSGRPGSFLDSSPFGLIYHSLSSGPPGRYIFQIRAGGILSLPAIVISPNGSAAVPISGITLSVPGHPAAKIYYTLNGTTPTTLSTLYAGPLTISQSAILEAIALESKFVDSPVAVASFGALPPTILSISGDQVASYGSSATFIARTTGKGPLTYQWYFNGTPLNGEVGPTLWVLNVNRASAGSYSVVVTGNLGQTASASASLIVKIPLVQFSPASSGAFPVNVQLSVPNVPGITILYRTDGQEPHVGFATTYTGPITVIGGMTVKAFAFDTQHILQDSGVSTAVFGSAPSVVRPPQDQTIIAGGTATFTADVRGSGPLSYQWLLNGASISGATAPSLILNNVQTSSQGDYSVRVSNVFGTVTSDTAFLEVDLKLPPVVFTPAASTTLPVSVSLSVPGHPYAAIFYTLDNTEPTSSSSSYTGPMNLQSATTIGAIAFESGSLPSDVSTASFGYGAGPTVSITAPASGTYSGLVTINVQSSDIGGISSVALYVDGSLMDSISTDQMGALQTAQFTLDTSGFPSGSHTLTAEARDNTGITYLGGSSDADVAVNSTMSAPVTVTFQNPIVWLNSDFDPIFQNYLPVLASVQNFPATWALSIFTEAGALVRTLSGSTFDGVIQTQWDGLDANGVQVPRDSAYRMALSSSTSGSATAVHWVWEESPWMSGEIVLARQRYKGSAVGSTFNTILANNIQNNVSTLIESANLEDIVNTGNRGVYSKTVMICDHLGVYSSLLTALKIGTVRDFYYHGHANGGAIGFSEFTPSEGLKTKDFSDGFLNTWTAGSSGSALKFKKPFRFVFIDGCNSANGKLPEAFGIPGAPMRTAYFKASNKKPRAFMGWSTTKGNSIANDAFVRFTLSFWAEWLKPPYDRPLYQAIAKALASNPSVQGKAIPIVYGSNQLTWKE